ncbi:MAG: amidohydrolase family protein [Rhodospirillales bacterium]
MPTLYRGGRIFDGVDRIIDGHAIAVQDGKIARIAPVAEFDGFTGQTVDTTSTTLLPGLMDAHVHILYGGEPNPSVKLEEMTPAQITLRGMEHANATLRGGVTAIRDCGGRDYMEFAIRDACNSGRYLGPSVRAAGRIICMTGGHGNRHGRVADGVDDVVKAVREQIHKGSDLVKIMATGGVMTPGVNPEDAHYSAAEIAAGIAEATRFNKTTASHAQGAAGILNATLGGVTSIEHGIFMDDECCQAMLERGTYLVPTLAALANILGNANKGIPDYVVEKSQRCAEQHRKSIQKFYKAGGKIALGTDAGTPFNYHGENAQELTYMVDNGISPMDALRFGTSAAADLLRLDDRGILREGLAADLLIVRGDPTTDISMAADKANHLAVVKNGTLINTSTDNVVLPDITRHRGPQMAAASLF